MKTLVTGFLLLLMVAAFAVAGGKEEVAWGVQEGPVVVGISGERDRPLDPEKPDGEQFYADYLFGDKDYEVELRFYSTGASGADSQVQADIDAGDGPDILFDYMGRASFYANSKYAVDLTDYIAQDVIDQYIPSFLGLMQKDGGQYGIPGDAWISAMIVNVTLLERVGMGYIIEQGEWSIDEFLEASRKVKALGPDYYGYHLFSATTGGDYWFLGFLPGFGANLYADGKIALDTDAGRAALEFYRDFAKEGLCPPGPAAIPFNDFLASFQKGKILAYANSPQAVGPTFTELGSKSFASGSSEEAYVAMPFPFPKADGVKTAPVALGPDGAVVFRKPGGVSKEVIDALMTIIGPKAQEWAVTVDGRWSSLNTLVDVNVDNKAWQAGNAILQSEGVWDMGVGLAAYGAVRVLVPPLFQAVYTEELSIQEAIDRFVEEGNAALGF